MNYLEEKIEKEARIIENKILDVTSFLNHQIDVELMHEIAKTFSNYFKNKNITKVVTIESSGITPGILTALELNVPLVVLKKGMSKTLNKNIYKTKVKSTTKGNVYDLVVSSNFIKDDDRILIIDDFLGTGEVALAAIELIQNTNASIVGLGMVVEMTFKLGRRKIEDKGLEVYSMVRIKSLENNRIEFI